MPTNETVAYNNKPQIMCRIDLNFLNTSFLNELKNNTHNNQSSNRRRGSNQSQKAQDDDRLMKSPASRNRNNRNTTNNNQDDDDRLSSSKENLAHPQFMPAFIGGSQLENGRTSRTSCHSQRMDGGSSSRSRCHSSRERSVGGTRGEDYFSPKSYDDQASNSSSKSSSIKKESIKTEFISSLPDYNNYNSSSPKLNLGSMTTENGSSKKFSNNKIKRESIKAEFNTDLECKGVVNKNLVNSSASAESLPNVERKKRSSATSNSYKEKKRKTNGAQVS